MLWVPVCGKNHPQHSPCTASLATYADDEQLGGTVIEQPCIHIDSYTEISLAATTANLPALNYAIFVSANAVHAIMPNHKPAADTMIMAIGPGTADALMQYDLPSKIPSHASSESLLSMTELQQVNSRNIAIYCGNNSKPLLKNQLQQRGAIVHIIECYRREIAQIEQRSLKQLASKQLDAIVVTSTASLVNLVTLIGEQHSQWLYHQPLLVISEAMVQHALRLGWQRTPWAASSAIDQAIVDALLTHIDPTT
jgi:uroporphyrinogen-III synthase